MRDARIGEMAARLHSNSVRLLRMTRQEEEGGGIGASRLSALTAAALSGPVSLAELASAERVSAPTMTRIVDGLVADGLVTRETDPRDRRAVRISATPAGRRTLEDGREQRVRALSSQLARLAESERRALYRGIELMERITRN